MKINFDDAFHIRSDHHAGKIWGVTVETPLLTATLSLVAVVRLASTKLGFLSPDEFKKMKRAETHRRTTKRVYLSSGGVQVPGILFSKKSPVALRPIRKTIPPIVSKGTR